MRSLLYENLDEIASLRFAHVAYSFKIYLSFTHISDSVPVFFV